MNDLDDLYGNSDNGGQRDNADETIGDTKMTDNTGAQDDNDDNEGDDESDSDVEFLITTKPGQRAEPPATKAQPYAAIKIQKPGGSNAATTSVPTKKEPVAKLPDVEVDAIAEMDGKSILEIDLESLEHKPWRQPGADITEYFNYGFDEFTWAAYCQKQNSLRRDFAPDKVMQGMMGAMDPMMGPMGAGMMMPPMDPNMMQQMYGAMPMDFMAGAPNNFGMPQMPQQQQQQQQYQRSSQASNTGQRPENINSPLGEQQQQREDSIPNAPRGPSQSRTQFRPRNGNGSRW